jgi:hypothetical protein
MPRPFSGVSDRAGAAAPAATTAMVNALRLNADENIGRNPFWP